MIRSSLAYCVAGLLAATSLTANANMFNEQPVKPQQTAPLATGATPSPLSSSPLSPRQNPVKQAGMPPAFAQNPTSAISSGGLPGMNGSASPYVNAVPATPTNAASTAAPVDPREQFDMKPTTVYKGKINGVHVFHSSESGDYDTRKAGKVKLVRSLQSMPSSSVASAQSTPDTKLAVQPAQDLPSAVGRPSPNLPIMSNRAPAASTTSPAASAATTSN